MKIAIVVHGRFFSFDFAREMVRQGHEVALYTNYPKKIAENFGIPKKNTRSYLGWGVLSRFFQKLEKNIGWRWLEPYHHRGFGKAVLRDLRKERWDVIMVFSGVYEEIGRHAWPEHTVRLLVRASSHIRTQAKLLEEESRRAGVDIEGPSPWMIAREEREYALADLVVVLSEFSKRSFVEQGFDAKKIRVLNLGAQLARFRPRPECAEARRTRILSGQPLRVLMVGTFSFRKGALDYLSIARALGSKFHFRFVGKVDRNLGARIRENPTSLEFIPKQPEFQLPSFYEWADIFIFPTIEDGFPAVLSQAQASGLPLLATENCSSRDILREGESGWVLPIRDAAAFIDRLRWCDSHRGDLAKMAQWIYETHQSKDWADAARDFTNMYEAFKE